MAKRKAAAAAAAPATNDLSPTLAAEYQASLAACTKASEAVNVLAAARKAARLNIAAESTRKQSLGRTAYVNDLRERGLVYYAVVEAAYLDRMTEILAQITESE